MTLTPRRIALLLEYDGGRYHGFQVQQNALTVQGVVEEALRLLTGEDTRLNGAGRTDAGVHAAGQVATFVTASHHDASTFQRALNARLPEDVSVLDACEVAPEFDARRHATRRWYRYVMFNRPGPSPLLRGRPAWARSPLDVAAMNVAARLLEGMHDFAGFSGPLSKPGSTVRHCLGAAVRREGAFVVLDIEATAFLPQQVRRTAAVLMDIGRGVCGAGRVVELLERPVLGAADHAAPPQGLYLMGVTYPVGTVQFAAQDATAMAHLALSL